MGSTSAKVKNRWNAKAYEELKIFVKRGKKDIIKARAAEQGLSINAYVNQLINNDLEEIQKDLKI